MSAFYVGQRVRHRYTISGIVPVGAEGRIEEIQVGRKTDVGTADCRVRWACLSDCRAWSRFDQLEPILPEGAVPSEFTTLADLLTSLNVEVPA